MSNDQSQIHRQVNDDQYLKIWEIEQEHMRTRWTVTTFFMSVSFAIFGFSFQLSPSQALAARLAGLVIYWFAYIQFAHMYSYSRFLRDYLAKMETSGQTSLDIMSQLRGSGLKRPVRNWETDRWLLALGVIYTLGMVILWWLHL